MNGIDLGVHNVQRGLDALAVLLQPQKQHLDIAQVGRRPCDKAAAVSARFGGLTQHQRDEDDDPEHLPRGGLP